MFYSFEHSQILKEQQKFSKFDNYIWQMIFWHKECNLSLSVDDSELPNSMIVDVCRVFDRIAIKLAFLYVQLENCRGACSVDGEATSADRKFAARVTDKNDPIKDPCKIISKSNQS
jgi:hypothetical protein